MSQCTHGSTIINKRKKKMFPDKITINQLKISEMTYSFVEN